VRTAAQRISGLHADRILVLAAVAVALTLPVFSSSALASSSPPVIGSTVAYSVTQSDATLEAWINPGELPEGVYYQFQVVANRSEYLSELACPEHGVQLLKPDGCGGPDSGPTTPGALPIGFIEKEPESRYVRLDLAAAGMTLKPGATYHYRVLAAKRVQSEDTLNWQGPPAVGPDQTFTTLTPGTPPRIEGETTSNITSNDATLEAKIDPEGFATTYEFYLEAPSCQNDKRVEACEAGGGVPIAKGSVPADSAAQTVSVDVAATGHSLSPNTIEGYRVVASNSAGTSYGGEQTFVTLPGSPPVINPVSVSMPEDGVEPLAATTSPPSGAGQPGVSNAGNQPAGSGGASSSPTTAGVGVLGAQIGKTIALEPLRHAQKLARLKACKRKPKKQWAACAKQARKRYGKATKKTRF
jgi:hypothetical protein